MSTRIPNRKVWSAPRKIWPGDVSHDQLRREVNEAYQAWCERRGLHAYLPDPVFARADSNAKPSEKGSRGGRRMGAIFKPKLHEIASALVAMGKPPRGLMKRLAEQHGLSYHAVASLVCYKRAQLRAKGKAA